LQEFGKLLDRDIRRSATTATPSISMSHPFEVYKSDAVSYTPAKAALPY
jgi:hypothetical protein